MFLWGRNSIDHFVVVEESLLSVSNEVRKAPILLTSQKLEPSFVSVPDHCLRTVLRPDTHVRLTGQVPVLPFSSSPGSFRKWLTGYSVGLFRREGKEGPCFTTE